MAYSREEINMIKLVINATPIYLISILKIPLIVRDKIQVILWSFLWPQNVKEKAKIPLLTWYTVFLPKDKCGLGIQDLEHSNKALEAKLFWRLYKNSLLKW